MNEVALRKKVITTHNPTSSVMIYCVDDIYKIKKLKVVLRQIKNNRLTNDEMKTKKARINKNTTDTRKITKRRKSYQISFTRPLFYRKMMA